MTNPAVPATTRKVFYQLDHGVVVIIPYFPIFQAGLPVPGFVTKPDGTKIWVEFWDEGKEKPGS